MKTLMNMRHLSLVLVPLELGSEVGWSIGADNTLAFFYFVETVGDQICEYFRFSGGPEDFRLVDVSCTARPK